MSIPRRRRSVRVSDHSLRLLRRPPTRDAAQPIRISWKRARRMIEIRAQRGDLPATTDAAMGATKVLELAAKLKLPVDFLFAANVDGT